MNQNTKTIIAAIWLMAGILWLIVYDTEATARLAIILFFATVTALAIKQLIEWAIDKEIL